MLRRLLNAMTRYFFGGIMAEKVCIDETDIIGGAAASYQHRNGLSHPRCCAAGPSCWSDSTTRCR